MARIILEHPVRDIHGASTHHPRPHLPPTKRAALIYIRFPSSIVSGFDPDIGSSELPFYPCSVLCGIPRERFLVVVPSWQYRLRKVQGKSSEKKFGGMS